MNEGLVQRELCRRFVCRLLHDVGAVVVNEDDIWSVRLGPSVAATLNMPPEFRFTCRAEAAVGDVELMTPEHPLVATLIQRVRDGHSHFRLMMGGVGLNDRIRRALQCCDWIMEEGGYGWAPLYFENVRARPVEKRLVYEPVYWFRFAVVYVADVHEERYVDVWLDAQSESPVPSLAWQDAAGLPWIRASVGADYSYQRLHDVAKQQLLVSVQPQLVQWHSEGQTRLTEEIRRIEAYYRDVAAEATTPLHDLLRPRPSLAAAVHGKEIGWEAFAAVEKVICDELDVLEAQQQRHIQEAERRHRGRAEARLISVVCLYVPRVHWLLRLGCQQRPTVAVCYDVTRDAVTEPRCDRCDSMLRYVTVTDEGLLCCRDCAALQKLAR